MNAILSNSNYSVVSNAKAVIAPPQEQMKIPSHLLDFLKADPTIKNKKKIAAEIKALPSDKLMEALDEFFNYLTEQGNKLDSSEAMSRLAEIIPLKELEDAVRTKFPQHIDALHTAKSLFKEAQYYLEMSQQNNTSSFKAKLQSILDTLIICLESVIGAFGVADFFKPSESDMQASTKAQRVFALFSLFSLLLTAMVPLLGAAVAAPIVAGVLLVVATLSLVYPYIKPMPHRINKTVNWSKMLRENNLPTSPVKKEYLDQMAQALISGEKVKTHPMLMGKSGVGKTETAKAFVKAIERGDYPELKGKEVFYINSADITNGPGRQEGGNKELQKISEAMGRHRKNIILIFDEIHILCQKKNNSLAVQLQTILEDPHEGFPNVIGITTQQEFYRDIYRHNAAFARRFKQINIENLGDEEVKQVLNGTLIQKAGASLVDHQAMSYLFQETKKAFPAATQPAASIKILAQCIKQTSETQQAPLEKRIDAVHKEIDLLNAENVLGQDGLLPYNRKNFGKINELEQNLVELERQLEVYQKEVAEVYHTREKLGRIKKQAYKNILKISKQIKKRGKTSKKLLKEYLLQAHFLAPAMEQKVRHKADQLNVKAVINQELIDEVIDEEVENQERINEAVQGGKEDVEARENGN